MGRGRYKIRPSNPEFTINGDASLISNTSGLYDPGEKKSHPEESYYVRLDIQIQARRGGEERVSVDIPISRGQYLALNDKLNFSKSRSKKIRLAAQGALELFVTPASI